MPKKPTADKPGQDSATSKWWVDLGGTEKVGTKRPTGPAGSRFFQAAQGYDQERARERLTDNNLKLLRENELPEGGWGYVRLAETTYPERELERIKKLVGLPAYARGLIVDCGRSIRLLITGTPVGDRLLELTLAETPSFDCWVHQDWVREALFDDADKALKALRRFIEEYLSPEGIARSEAIAARA